jgi:hypothetical protein
MRMNKPIESENLGPAVKNFLEANPTALPAYRYGVLSFVAVVHEGYENILRARLQLCIEAQKALIGERSIFGLRAAQLPFPMASTAIPELLRTVLSGERFAIGNHLLKLLADAPRGYSTHHEDSEQFHRRTGDYGDRLVVSGANPWPLLTPRQQELDRALQAQAFDSLGDLLNEYGLDAFGMSAECTFEIITSPVARLDSSSTVSDSTATVSVRLALGLRPEGFQLVLRNAIRHESPHRRIVEAAEFHWTALGDEQLGRSKFQVPRALLLEYRALYAGKIQDLQRLADPAAMPNLRRVVVEINDPKLVNLTTVLTGIRERDDGLRNEFEASVAVLFYLLGFDAVRISGSRRATDGPDTYALVESDELLVIESTSGAFSDEKCAKLIARVKNARQIWSRVRPELDHTQITGIVVTARRREELVAQLSALEKQGILILCHAEIVDAIEQTLVAPAPQEILRRWRQRPLQQILTRGIEVSRE